MTLKICPIHVLIHVSCVCSTSRLSLGTGAWSAHSSSCRYIYSLFQQCAVHGGQMPCLPMTFSALWKCHLFLWNDKLPCEGKDWQSVWNFRFLLFVPWGNMPSSRSSRDHDRSSPWFLGVQFVGDTDISWEITQWFNESCNRQLKALVKSMHPGPVRLGPASVPWRAAHTAGIVPFGPPDDLSFSQPLFLGAVMGRRNVLTSPRLLPPPLSISKFKAPWSSHQTAMLPLKVAPSPTSQMTLGTGLSKESWWLMGQCG